MPTTELLVAGMECQSCGNAVSAVLRKLPGVRSVEVFTDSGKALVEHAPGAPETAVMIAAVDREGYSADLIGESH